MTYARVQDGQVVATRLPRRGILKDGRSVSGYHLLPAKTLHLEGWREVSDDGPPDYDPATHEAKRTLVVQNDQVVASYEVVELPPPPPEDTSEEDFLGAVRGANSLAELKAALLGEAGPGAEARRRP